MPVFHAGSPGPRANPISGKDGALKPSGYGAHDQRGPVLSDGQNPVALPGAWADDGPEPSPAPIRSNGQIGGPAFGPLRLSSLPHGDMTGDIS
jgi:hypothetical protein